MGWGLATLAARYAGTILGGLIIFSPVGIGGR